MSEAPRATHDLRVVENNPAALSIQFSKELISPLVPFPPFERRLKNYRPRIEAMTTAALEAYQAYARAHVALTDVGKWVRLDTVIGSVLRERKEAAA